MSSMDISGLQSRASKVVGNTREEASKYKGVTSEQRGVDISVEALQTAALINSAFDEKAIANAVASFVITAEEAKQARDMREFCGMLSYHTLQPAMKGAAFCVGKQNSLDVMMGAGVGGEFFDDPDTPKPLLQKWRIEWGDGWSGCMIAAQDIQDQVQANTYEQIMKGFGSGKGPGNSSYFTG